MFGKVDIGTMDASISRDGWVEFGWAEMIYCKISNGNEEISQVRREGWMNAGKRGYEMVFKGTDCAFSEVRSMISWRLKLSVYAWVIKEV